MALAGACRLLDARTGEVPGSFRVRHLGNDVSELSFPKAAASIAWVVVDELMAGGRFSHPVRRGAVVERAAAVPNVRALLRHFERVGFTLAPRLVGTAKGGARDVPSFIEGRAADYPLAEDVRSEEALANVARAARALHDAAGGFVPDEPDRWLPREASVPAHVDCIGHHDLAPWNIIFDGTQVAGIIDTVMASSRPNSSTWPRCD